MDTHSVKNHYCLLPFSISGRTLKLSLEALMIHPSQNLIEAVYVCENVDLCEGKSKVFRWIHEPSIVDIHFLSEKVG